MGNPTGIGGAKPGEIRNPEGKPVTGYQDFKTRLAYWLQSKSVDEIENLVRNKIAWGKLSAIDAIVVRRIAQAAKKAGTTADFTAVLDRFVGKPVQPIAGEFKVTHGLAERLERARSIVSGNAVPIIESSSSLPMLQAIHSDTSDEIENES